MKALLFFCVAVSVTIALVASVTGLPYEWIAAIVFIFSLLVWVVLVARVVLQATTWRAEPQYGGCDPTNRLPVLRVTAEVVHDDAMTRLALPAPMVRPGPRRLMMMSDRIEACLAAAKIDGQVRHGEVAPDALRFALFSSMPLRFVSRLADEIALALDVPVVQIEGDEDATTGWVIIPTRFQVDEEKRKLA